MKRILALLLVAALSALLLSGCSLDSAFSSLTSKLDEFTATGLVVRVTRVEENGVRAKVVTGDSHFKESESIYLYFDQIIGTNKVSVTDNIQVSYDYAKNVTTDNGVPVITVEVVSLYIPED